MRAIHHDFPKTLECERAGATHYKHCHPWCMPPHSAASSSLHPTKTPLLHLLRTTPFKSHNHSSPFRSKLSSTKSQPPPQSDLMHGKGWEEAWMLKPKEVREGFGGGCRRDTPWSGVGQIDLHSRVPIQNGDRRHPSGPSY
jgi:hypothetical protein